MQRDQDGASLGDSFVSTSASRLGIAGATCVAAALAACGGTPCGPGEKEIAGMCFVPSDDEGNGGGSGGGNGGTPTVDTFNSAKGFDGEVMAVAVTTDGDVYAAGSFSKYNGRDSRGLIRLNPDGSVDTSFNVGSGFDEGVWTVTLASGGRVYVAGGFSDYNGTTRNRLLRLNSNGSIDESFNIGTGFRGGISGVALAPSGGVYVVGDYDLYKGVARFSILRLDNVGTVDTTFDVGTDDVVTGLGGGLEGGGARAIAVAPDGSVFVGGDFTFYKGVAQNRIVHLDSTGTRVGFLSGNGFSGGTNTAVNALAIAPEPAGGYDVIVGGDFDVYTDSSGNASDQYRIARINSDGLRDASFESNPGGFNGPVRSLARSSTGDLYVGGEFTSYRGTPKSRIVRLARDGSVGTGFDVGPGANEAVSAMALTADGDLYLGGDFSTYNGSGCHHMVRANSNGSVDPAFPVSSGFDKRVSAVAFAPDGDIYLGGDFATYNGVASGHIIRLNSDGSIDPAFVVGAGFNNSVHALALAPNGDLYVGGNFTTYQGMDSNRLIRLRSDGSIDADGPTAFNVENGFEASVLALALASDGDLYVGGGFTSYASASDLFGRIIRLNSDGSSDTTFINVDQGFNGPVRSLALAPSGDLYVGGEFTNYVNSSGTTANARIVRLNNTGSVVTSYGTGFNEVVTSLALASDGDLYVGGGFTAYQGSSCNRVVRLDPDSDIDQEFTVATPLGAGVLAIAIAAGGDLLVGGPFIAMKGGGRNHALRLSSTGTLDTAFNVGSGFDSDVATIAVAPDGDTYFGGDFTSYKSSIVDSLARVSPTGDLR